MQYTASAGRYRRIADRRLADLFAPKKNYVLTTECAVANRDSSISLLPSVSMEPPNTTSSLFFAHLHYLAHKHSFDGIGAACTKTSTESKIK